MSPRDAGRRSWLAALAALALVVIVLAVLALTGGGGGGAPPTPAGQRAPGPPGLPAPSATALGISVNRLFLDGTFSPAQINAQLSALAATGATDARVDTLWEATEPSPPVDGIHRYDWAFDDTIAGALAAHGLRWLPIIDYSVSWAQSLPGQDNSAPKYPAAYAAYAAAFAGRYGSGGTFWHLHPGLVPRPVQALEIWNEPDGGVFWRPKPAPGAYADLYADTRADVKVVDPAMRVLIGGLGHPVAFLPAVLRARPDLRGHIDGVAIHPYAPNPTAVVARLRTARSLLDDLGLSGVPLYLTEFGWTPRPLGTPNYLPGALRPGYISATVSELAHTNCTVAGEFLYTWVTPERHPKVGDDWFGIHPPQGGSSPSQQAFSSAITSARRPVTPLRVC